MRSNLAPSFIPERHLNPPAQARIYHSTTGNPETSSGPLFTTEKS